ncbi:hypothetical protein V1L54_17815 [Streptomyces sp. TRM 70361]|uniref:hypothetical protein n=1 Tax=Streptomyces sp. TRM 70361 TaxID=3116553 RepID=UPI002E7ADCB6|nr:hypothetical protein [Streptomyces sp. TRM 70361]MEE1941240.1 hypothetical protein [Streptomyces sp. TRM 70361]
MPGPASAAPGNGREAAEPRGFAQSPAAEAPARADAIWECERWVSVPAYHVDFTCTVFSGAVRAYVVCSDGAVFYSRIMYAGALYQMRGTCGPPWTVRTSGEQPL